MLVGVRNKMHAAVLRPLFKFVRPLKARLELTVTLPPLHVPDNKTELRGYKSVLAAPELQYTRVVESLKPVNGLVVTWMTVTAMLALSNAVLADTPNVVPPK